MEDRWEQAELRTRDRTDPERDGTDDERDDVPCEEAFFAQLSEVDVPRGAGPPRDGR